MENRAAHPHREFPGVPPLDLVCYEPFLVSSRNDPPHKLRDETQPRSQGFSLGKALGTRLDETKKRLCSRLSRARLMQKYLSGVGDLTVSRERGRRSRRISSSPPYKMVDQKIVLPVSFSRFLTYKNNLSSKFLLTC